MEKGISGTKIKSVGKTAGKKFLAWLIKNRSFWLGGLIGAICFIGIYGTKILNPLYDDWILAANSDLTQHYQGWQFFRRDGWSFPVGLFKSLSYPLEASIIFTDSIPVMAILFKVLSPILSQTFQYFGIWGILCFILQGAVSAKILEKYLKNTLAVCVGTVFFTTSVTMLLRMYMHTSLASQWLILLSILFLVYYEEYFGNWKRGLIGWSVIGALCASIHLYFLPMCGIVLLGYICRDLLETRSVKRAAGVLAAYLCSGALTVWLLGGFSCGGSAVGGGLGNYSFNLNGFFNPRSWSSLLPALPFVSGGQLEGLSYLGAGILLLLLISAGIFVVANRKRLTDGKWMLGTLRSAAPWVVILFLSVVAAVSPVVTWGDKVLFTLPVPSILQKVWSIFRGSGRLIWPAVYVLMLFAVCGGLKYGKIWMKWGCLLVCLAVQLYDIHVPLVKRSQSYRKETSYASILTDPVWNAIAQSGKIKHLVLRHMYSISPETMYRMAEYTYENGMDQNYYHYAHSLGEGPTLALAELMDNLSDDTVYVFDPIFRLRYDQYDLHYYMGNDYLIGLTWQLEGIKELDRRELGSISYEFEGNYWLSGGEDKNGVRRIHSNGVSYGPYIMIPEGTYQIVITGRNLEKGNFACTYNNGHDKISVEYLNITDTETSFYISLAEDVQRFELVVSNSGEEDILLEQVTIRGAQYGE